MFIIGRILYHKAALFCEYNKIQLIIVFHLEIKIKKAAQVVCDN